MTKQGAEQVDWLRQQAIFGALSDDAIRILLNDTEIEAVAAGDFYFREGDIGNAIYMLQEGHAGFFRRKSGNSEFIQIRDIHPGDSFGVMAILGIYPRSGSLRALSDCTALKITDAALFQLYQLNHDQYLLLLMNMARELSRRLRDSDSLLLEQMADKEQLAARSRLS